MPRLTMPKRNAGRAAGGRYEPGNQHERKSRIEGQVGGPAKQRDEPAAHGGKWRDGMGKKECAQRQQEFCHRCGLRSGFSMSGCVKEAIGPQFVQ